MSGLRAQANKIQDAVTAVLVERGAFLLETHVDDVCFRFGLSPADSAKVLALVYAFDAKKAEVVL
jgi:hypothetical protein